MPVDLNSLTEGWLELESDPGLFTLLLEDFGVRGVQVEEVYDLQKPIEGPVFGFIFLFKWNEERRSRRKPFVTDESFVQDEEIVNSIFFAQQIVPNSCATHALLSVLLNCNKIHLGETLTRLKEYTKNMSPENKGLAIGNTPELAKAHNSHAKPEPRRLQEKSQGFTTSRTMEAFHFVSYVPIGGQLFELDGLKPYPNNHGPWGEHEDWTEKFRCVMRERLGIATGGGHDIRFNLMAVVPDRRMAYEHKLRTLKTNRQIVLEALQQLVKMTHPELTSDDHAEYMAAVMRSKQQSRGSPGGHETATAAEEPPVEMPEESALSTTAASSVLTSTTERCISPSKSKASTRSSTPITSYMASHPALDSHNYAKSPLMEGISEEDPPRPRYEDCSGSDYTSEEENAGGCPSSKEVPLPPPPAVTQPIQINTKDYSHPLSIQTKFEASPTPSNSSTDTSSEVGSAFNSPVRTVAAGSAQSPTFCHGRDIKKFLVIRMTGGKDPAEEPSSQGAASRSSLAQSSRTSSSDASVGHDTRQNNEGATKRPLSASKLGEEDTIHIPSKRASSLSSPSSSYSERSLRSNKDENSPLLYGSRSLLERSEGGSVTSDRVADIHKAMERSGDKKDGAKYPQLIEPHSFAPKDLLALLKNVENEILNCESNLRDEIDKRKKYKVDDCRRTHNYDRFICSFLSMLAQQGKLADLVDKHVLVKRRQGITVGRLHKKTDRRRRSRTKKRK